MASIDSDTALTPIAVVGMALRVPGAVTPQRFWRNLLEGRDSLTRLSVDQLRRAGASSELYQDPRYVRTKPILDDIEYFDAAFFDISRSEADRTEPAHRMFLECAWEAMEDAGIVPHRGGPVTGVFAGCEGHYQDVVIGHHREHDDPAIDIPMRLGNALDFFSARVSHKLDLIGPSFSMLAACATSLIAVHLAVQSLRRGECAGIVSAVRSGVHDPQPGDEVVAVARNSLATHVTARSDCVTLTIVPPDQVRDVFNRMARAEDIGKIVFRVCDDLPPARSAARVFREEYGRGLPVRTGLEVFRCLLSSDETPAHVIVPGSRIDASADAPMRDRLPVGVSERGRPDLSSECRAPTSEVERVLARLWEKTLGIAPIDVEDNFFDLDGDSIEAIQIQHAINRDFDVSIKNTAFLDSPSIASLAELIEKSQSEKCNVSSDV